MDLATCDIAQLELWKKPRAAGETVEMPRYAPSSGDKIIPAATGWNSGKRRNSGKRSISSRHVMRAPLFAPAKTIT
jgi:hypothetical protein